MTASSATARSLAGRLGLELFLILLTRSFSMHLSATFSPTYGKPSVGHRAIQTSHTSLNHLPVILHGYRLGFASGVSGRRGRWTNSRKVFSLSYLLISLAS